MPVPHEKLPTCVPRNGQLLALMQHKFLRVPEFASQVPTLPDPDIFTFDKRVPMPKEPQHVPSPRRRKQAVPVVTDDRVFRADVQRPHVVFEDFSTRHHVGQLAFVVRALVQVEKGRIWYYPVEVLVKRLRRLGRERASEGRIRQIPRRVDEDERGGVAG